MSLNIKKYISVHVLLFIAILVVAVFFRFYNTPSRYGFDYDPTRDALIIDYSAKTLQLPLIGPPSGIGPFAFGPWYYYQLILFKIVFPLDYAPWIYIGIASTLSVFVMYRIGLLLGGKTLGLLLAAFSALSPAETGQIRALSNPTLIPLHAALVIWLFVKFIKGSPPLWMAFLWGLILGVGLNNHYQMLGLLPFPIILFIYKKDRRWMRIVTFIAGMSISFIPLLFFNLLHGWSTLRGRIFYVTQGKNALYFPNRWLYYIFNFWPAFWSYVLGVPEKLGSILMLFSGAIILYLFVKRKLQIAYIFIVSVLGINFLLLRNFPIRLEYYYLLYLHPVIFIIFGLAILRILNFKTGRYIALLILAVIFTGMFSQSIERLATREDQAQFKKEANTIIKNFPDKKFVLYECSSSQRNRVRGVIFFLNNYKKIREDGVKIAYPSDKCPFPVNRGLVITGLQGVDAVNISHISDDLLYKFGWKMVTPKSIFTQLSRGTL